MQPPDSTNAAYCDGSTECEAEQHIHGCFADTGNCDEPREHDAASKFPEGDPVEVRPSDSRAESQAGSNGPSGSPTSPSGRVSPAASLGRVGVFMDGTGITPGTEKCLCGKDCEFPCWQRLGWAPPCESCGCVGLVNTGYEEPCDV